MKEFALRTVTSVVFVIVMVAGLLLPYAGGALFLIVMATAMDEFYRMSLNGRHKGLSRFAILLCGISYIVLFGTRAAGLSDRWFALPVILFFIFLCSFVMNCKTEEAGQMSLLFTPVVIIALPLMFTPALLYPHGLFDGTLLLCIFIVVWLSDVGAYLIGSWLGQREGAKKLAPHISPKKSWWGFGGGVVCGMLIAAVLHFTGLSSIGFWHSIILGMLISVTSVFGDLLESLWKRHFGVKDSGKCIPGHGGMYDRFDSSFVAIPVAFSYLLIFGLI